MLSSFFFGKQDDALPIKADVLHKATYHTARERFSLCPNGRALPRQDGRCLQIG